MIATLRPALVVEQHPCPQESAPRFIPWRSGIRNKRPNETTQIHPEIVRQFDEPLSILQCAYTVIVVFLKKEILYYICY